MEIAVYVCRYLVPSPEYGAHVVNSTAQININKTAFHLSRKSGIFEVQYSCNWSICCHAMPDQFSPAVPLRNVRAHISWRCCRNLSILLNTHIAATSTQTRDSKLIQKILLGIFRVQLPLHVTRINIRRRLARKTLTTNKRCQAINEKSPKNTY